MLNDKTKRIYLKKNSTKVSHSFSTARRPTQMPRWLGPGASPAAAWLAGQKARMLPDRTTWWSGRRVGGRHAASLSSSSELF